MSGVITAIGVGAAATTFSSIYAANSASNSANQQLLAAQQTQQQALGYANATPAELSAQQSQLGIATQSLQYAQQQMGQYASMQATLSPTFTSAFGQIQDILGGGQTGLTAPAFAQFNIQRQQQQNQMQLAMGGGAAGSSAGAQSNALFGQQQGLMAMGVNTQALGTLQSLGQGAGGMMLQAGQAGTNAMAGASSANQAYAGMLGNVQNRQISALMGTNITPYSTTSGVQGMGIANGLSSLGGTGMGAANMINANNNTSKVLGVLGNGGNNIGLNVGMGSGATDLNSTMGNFPSGTNILA